MSRWLWALLGGVVLVAIAAVFWTASNQTNVTPPVSPGPTAGRTRAGRRPYCHRRPAPSAPPVPSAPAAQEARQTRRPLPLRRLMQDSKPPRNLLRPRHLPRRPRLLRSARRSATAAARARTEDAGSPERIRSQEPCAAGRDLGLFRGGLRAPLPAERRRLGLSAAGGQVRPGRDRRVAEENPSPFRHLPD